MSLQSFKSNDTTEAKVRDCLVPKLELIALGINEFYSGAYTCGPLGDVLAATGHPLAGVMPIATFRASYPAIHQLFSRPGTFEFYIELFRGVWGDDVTITFTVPDPGKLLIDIEALSAQSNLALARTIVDDVYVYDEIVDEDGDNLIFLGVQGLQSQRQAEALVRELHPSGVWAQVTLSIV